MNWKFWEKRGSMMNKSELDDYWFSERGLPVLSGVEVTKKTAMTISAVWACVRVLSESVGIIPLNLYERMDRGRKKATAHEIFSLLHFAPNPEMTAMVWREVMMGHLNLYGNHYSQIIKDRMRRVVELWPLSPERIAPYREKGGDLKYRFIRNDGSLRWFNADEILHIPGFGFDGLIGYSPITLHAETLGLSLATLRYGANFFGNDATPSIVLKYPNKLGPEGRKNLKDSWDEAHKGGKRGTAVIEEGGDVIKMSIPPNEAQFLETRKYQKTDIASIFRVPPHMIQDLDKATFSNIEHQSLDFVMYSLMPWLVRIEQYCWLKLLKIQERQDYYCEHLVTGLLRGDMKTRFESYHSARMDGWLSSNDIREMENMNPIPEDKGGDLYIVPLNMVPLDQIAGLQAKPVSVSGARSINERERLQNAYYRLFLESARRIVNRETIAVKRSIGKFLSKDDPVGFLEWLEDFYRTMPKYIQKDMLPVTMAFFREISLVAGREIGQEWTRKDETDRFATDYVTALTTRHVSSSENQIKALLKPDQVNEEDEPVTIEQIRVSVEERLDSWDQTRAEDIAQQETVQGNNAVARMVFFALGMSVIIWATRGSDPCPYCAMLNGKVIGKNQNFADKGELTPDGEPPMMIRRSRMHPPLHKGCVCGITAG